MFKIFIVDKHNSPIHLNINILFPKNNCRAEYIDQSSLAWLAC